MDLFRGFDLNLSTLLGILILPFVVVGYQRQLWYRPDLLRKLDGAVQLICFVLGVIFLLRLFTFGEDRTWDLVRWHLVHLLAVATPVMMLRRGGASQGAAKGSAGYRPIPLNSEVEKLGWRDLIIDDALRQELVAVVSLLRDAGAAKKYGIDPPKGILLQGPPGTGKTTIAKVIPNVAGLSFFTVRMDEVVSKWVGESEKNLSALFYAAQQHAPAVIFIDEVDSIGKDRSKEGQQWSQNLLNHLLQLIDGVVKAEGLYVIAATNRAELVDSALTRAGRLNRTIEIGLPDYQARQRIFELYLSKLKLDPHLDTSSLAGMTEGKSPADIRAICNQAGLHAFKRESVQGTKRDYTIRGEDLNQALREFL